jgi:hypothetical protein
MDYVEQAKDAIQSHGMNGWSGGQAILLQGLIDTITSLRQQLTKPADEPRINLTACLEPKFENPPEFEQSPSFEESLADDTISVSKGEWEAMKKLLDNQA